MSMSDPIADMLTRIRNAALREHKSVTIPSSNMKVNIAKVLKDEGFVDGYEVTAAEVGKDLKITLKYDSRGESVIRKIWRISKPGLRVFKGAADLTPQYSGQGIYIVSTSKGVMSDAQCRSSHVGGEVLCALY